MAYRTDIQTDETDFDDIDIGPQPLTRCSIPNIHLQNLKISEDQCTNI